ncbi:MULTISPECIES: hypothetical protein [unclassified Microcoleus]|uniref:hypothetical protein n=1 Tax=unclassified Microcoleus TaxID=2642155 RepID=UPI002FD65FB9
MTATKLKEKLDRLSDELASALEAERQRAPELTSLLPRYRARFGEISESNG